MTPIPAPPELLAKFEHDPRHHSVLAFGHNNANPSLPIVLILVDSHASWWNQNEVDHLCWENGACP